MNILARVFDQMARMGLAFKADPIKVIEIEGREWGNVAGGFDLSIAPRRDQKDLLSVILRNIDPLPRRIVTHGWLCFLNIQIEAPDGSEVPLSSYGKVALDPARAKSDVAVQLGPHEMVETELPLSLLFDMKIPGVYRVKVSCRVPGGVLTSNECLMKHS